MIASVQVADVGALGAAALLAGSRSLRPDSVPGLRFGRTLIAGPLSSTALHVPQLTRIGLLAFWDDEAAFNAFVAQHPLAARLASGWQARLVPVRVTGSWPGLPSELSSASAEGGPAPSPSPAVVLTIGRLKLGQAVRFLRTNVRAEAAALASPGLLWATALARPPLVVSCSLWRSTVDLAAYAYRPGPHKEAIAANQAKPFHHQSAFVRFRPIRLSGHLDGVNPLAEEPIFAD